MTDNAKSTKNDVITRNVMQTMKRVNQVQIIFCDFKRNWNCSEENNCWIYGIQ
jgi:hypothetical protein